MPTRDPPLVDHRSGIVDEESPALLNMFAKYVPKLVLWSELALEVMEEEAIGKGQTIE